MRGKMIEFNTRGEFFEFTLFAVSHGMVYEAVERDGVYCVVITGDKLPENLKREVLRSFTNRITTGGENGYPQDNPCGAK